MREALKRKLDSVTTTVVSTTTQTRYSTGLTYSTDDQPDLNFSSDGELLVCELVMELINSNQSFNGFT